MSRTRSTSGGRNPAKKFLEWKSEQKAWQGWDKEKEEKFLVPADTAFIVLDMLSTVTGYSKQDGGIGSNEVRNATTDELEVHAAKRLIFTGLWKDVKTGVRDARFATSVYALAKVDGEYQLVNFKMSGCALRAWIEFVDEQGGRKAVENGDMAIHIKETMEGKSGSVTYNSPVFAVASKNITEDAKGLADAADRELQAYLDDYLRDDLPDATQGEGQAEPAEDEGIPVF